MRPVDLAARLTPNELRAVREAVAAFVRENPAWTAEAAAAAADLILAGDGDDGRAMKCGLIGAVAIVEARNV